MLRRIVPVTSLLAFGGAMLGAGPAIDPLATQTQGEVEFVSGGVSDAEQQAIRERAGDFDLWITVARSDGAYLSDVDVSVDNTNGRTILDTTTRGPSLLVDLPKGTYEVTAKADGWQSQRLQVAIDGDGTTRVNIAMQRAGEADDSAVEPGGRGDAAREIRHPAGSE